MRNRMLAGLAVLILISTGAGAFWAGRLTGAEPRPTVDRGYDAGYADGLRVGRALQATLNLPATDKAIFESGYTAGATDVFTGYDGGWDHNAPYVIVLAPGGPTLAYRIASRTRLNPGMDYYLCPDGHKLCQRPR